MIERCALHNLSLLSMKMIKTTTGGREGLVNNDTYCCSGRALPADARLSTTGLIRYNGHWSAGCVPRHPRCHVITDKPSAAARGVCDSLNKANQG